MNSKLVTFFALFAVLFGCAMCNIEQAEAASTIKLQVFGSSSIWWIAVDPKDEVSDTTTVELREASSSKWTALTLNADWGYFQLASYSGRGFDFPLSFRLTASNGAQVTVNSLLTAISSGSLIDTGVQYSLPATQAPTATPEAPTQRPTQRPTQAPTKVPTQAPTQRPTQAPTSAPTQAPTEKPTHAPTAAPTQAPTAAPTQAPTAAPTQAPTEKPTHAPTAAPTTTPRPTNPPTQAPTTTPRPTTPPTNAPTKAPTNPPSTSLCGIVPTSSEPIKVLVPLYVYPGSDWDELVTAANAGVQIIAIINPNSGPDSTGPDSSYVTYMKKLTDAGIEMVGYIHTSWGARAISLITGEIDTYASLYTGVTGIFFDEASVNAADVPYYTTAYNYVMAKSGFQHTILNPGAEPVQQYMDISTSIVIYEDYASSLSSAKFDSWVTCAASASAKAGYKYKFSGIVHTAALASMPSYISTLQSMGMGLVYVTDGVGGCCTYNTLASYFAQEASTVVSIN